MSTAVSKAGNLKPEIRLAQALSEYCACLGESRAREFKSLRTTSPPTPQDVITLTEEINRDGSRKHRAWRPYATRTAMFLDKVQTLSRIGDFLVGSSQNLMASGIWATVKITLGIAVGSLSFFKRISELFLKVGRSASITRDLVEVFPNSSGLQDLMCEYLIVLVSFCKDVVQVLQKPTILQLSSPFIAFFDKEASKFETDLTQLSTAIDRMVAALVSQSQVESANTISRMSRTLSQWSARSEAKKQQDLARRSIHVQDRLSSPSEQRQRIAVWRRQRKKGDSRWLFEERGYKNWKAAHVASSVKASILRIHGKLGSGKTVLLASIVAELYALRTTDVFHQLNIIAYFFCDDDYADSITAEQILGSLFQQILGQLEPDSECAEEMERLFQESDPDFPPLHTQARILGSTWPQERSVFIVVDGLDRCKNWVVEDVVSILLSIPELFGPTCSSSWIRLCFSSRTDSLLKNLLHRKSGLFQSYQFPMANGASKSEMQDFVESEFERRSDIRKLDKELEGIIRDVLVGASEGMYLWVALQIEALFPLHGSTLLSPSDILELLENPPKDLSDAFNNALRRISDTRYGKTIFQLIATAKRPLTISELKIALHVKPGDTDWTLITPSFPQDERAIVGLCGGGLLEIDEEDNTVRFIHHSVAQHLQQPIPIEHQPTPYHFQTHEADMHMGFICTTYLNYSIFNTSLSTVSKAAVHADQFANKIAEGVSAASVSTGAQVASKVIAAITQKQNRNRQEDSQLQNMDIGRLLQRYMQPKGDSTEIMAFSDYAREHWIWHSNRLWVKSDTGPYRQFKALLTATPEHITVPWDTSEDISDIYGFYNSKGRAITREAIIITRDISIQEEGSQDTLANSHNISIRTKQSVEAFKAQNPKLFAPRRGVKFFKDLLPDQKRETWLRWALRNWHFGILFEAMDPKMNDELGLEYSILLREVFHEALLDRTEGPSPDDDDGFDPRPRARAHILHMEPHIMFDRILSAAQELCRSFQSTAIKGHCSMFVVDNLNHYENICSSVFREIHALYTSQVIA